MQTCHRRPEAVKRAFLEPCNLNILNNAYLNAPREASTFLLQHLTIQRAFCMII